MLHIFITMLQERLEGKEGLREHYFIHAETNDAGIEWMKIKQPVF